VSLTHSEHIEPTRAARDCHYMLRDGKPAMKIWNREHSEKCCVKCHRGAYPYEEKCPRCGGDLE
jgi:hypothetical protein